MKKSVPQKNLDAPAPRLIERPDGFYWQDPASGKLSGPFATMQEAEADIAYRADSDYEEGESLEEAEDEIGILGWVDPDTGDLAEGAAPHLSDE
ncbi:MAG: hypothetical protein LBG66_00165 [Gallionellaceae bacterium]|jgi:hypothetical protein|nr:hypothetical protein [Gallionellaceae bacterium]